MGDILCQATMLDDQFSCQTKTSRETKRSPRPGPSSFSPCGPESILSICRRVVLSAFSRASARRIVGRINSASCLAINLLSLSPDQSERSLRI